MRKTPIGIYIRPEAGETRKNAPSSASAGSILPPFRMNAIAPFVILLIVGLVFNYIPMDGRLKQAGNLIIGIVAIVMLLRFAGVL